MVRPWTDQGRSESEDPSGQPAPPRMTNARSRLAYFACEMGMPAGDLGFSDAAFSALRAPTMI
jgi:hypothetical protein